MRPAERGTYQLLGGFAIGILMCLILFLASCTLCPHDQCPVIIEANR